MSRCAFYSTSLWKKLRKHQLNHHPLCRTCLEQGHVTAASVVDHIIPHRGDWSLFSDPGNLQSLCTSHHSATKQREEARGHVIGVDVDGMPLDPGHHWRIERV